jgi:hypothetical protein
MKRFVLLMALALPALGFASPAPSDSCGCPCCPSCPDCPDC